MDQDQTGQAKIIYVYWFKIGTQFSPFSLFHNMISGPSGTITPENISFPFAIKEQVMTKSLNGD